MQHRPIKSPEFRRSDSDDSPFGSTTNDWRPIPNPKDGTFLLRSLHGLLFSIWTQKLAIESKRCYSMHAELTILTSGFDSNWIPNSRVSLRFRIVAGVGWLRNKYVQENNQGK